MTIVDFVLARITEDDVDGPWHMDWCRAVGDDTWPCDCTGPARLRAECEVKRLMVAAIQGEWGDDPATHRIYGTGLLELAAIYANHPDYDESWCP